MSKTPRRSSNFPWETKGPGSWEREVQQRERLQATVKDSAFGGGVSSPQRKVENHVQTELAQPINSPTTMSAMGHRPLKL